MLRAAEKFRITAINMKTKPEKNKKISQDGSTRDG